MNEKVAIVIDPTVVCESNDGIRKAKEQKRNKYQRLTQTIVNQYKVDKVEIKGFAVGALGGWHKQNTKTLQMQGINDKNFEAHFCRLALKGTINLTRLFMDG